MWSIFMSILDMWSIFELCGRFYPQLCGRFWIIYVVDFTPQAHIGQDSIVISYIMDTFSPHKILYRSIKKAMRFFARLRNLLFLIFYSVQFLTGIIPTQAAYRKMSVRSPVFGKIMTTCCPNRLLFYNTNIRYSIITKHPLYNSISSLLLKRPANRSITIPFVPL